ncbi:hypothetical protein Taro_025547 [Colocasia esculenta]|uniref:Uncharacterized protein n=1 Tax=Colocasia esculenta TaxID=4460 RepID=A0A843VKU1_COLES|nr:hypothetical protein [Colocasia esculenta]
MMTRGTPRHVVHHRLQVLRSLVTPVLVLLSCCE